MAVYYNDADPAACAWLRELIAAGLLPAGDVDERSILEVEPADLRGFAQCHFFAGIGGWPYALRLAGVAGELSVWTGLPPCQPFSQAGQRKGQDDDRHLAPAFLRLVAACRPELVFGEQVASAAVLGPVGGAARTAAHGPTGWAWFDALAADLEAASYAVAAADLPAAGFEGARKRSSGPFPPRTRAAHPPAPVLRRRHPGRSHARVGRRPRRGITRTDRNAGRCRSMRCSADRSGWRVGRPRWRARPRRQRTTRPATPMRAAGP